MTKIFVPPVPVESNHPLFILYTSGTTNKPKGVVHSTGGYLTQVFLTFAQVFGPAAIRQPAEGVYPHTKNFGPEINTDTQGFGVGVYWCTADLGWITGHSYVVYGPLMHAATIFMYEGAPDFPNPGRWWNLIQKYKVSVFYTSPTVIRMAMQNGEKWIKKYNLSTLKILGSVGEILSGPLRRWYAEVIGHKKCPIKDTWWQTETGGIMIVNGRPIKGISTKVTKKELVIDQPWPGQFIKIWGRPKSAQKIYQTGDLVKKMRGRLQFLGRADDTINISGHRIAPAEIENIVSSEQSISEVAAVGKPDEIKGEKLVLFVVLKKGSRSQGLKTKVSRSLRQLYGPIATPSKIYFVKELPKTRSGKIMRRKLKNLNLC